MQEPRGVSLELGYSTDLSVPVPAESRIKITGPESGTRGVRELYVEYNPPRNRPRALQGGRQCRRHRSNEREECAAREPERAWNFSGDRWRLRGQSGEREHSVFNLIFEMTTVDKHEYFKMIRAREERIRTFMQLELEACLDWKRLIEG